MPYVPGIDVSAWEPNIDWRAVKNSGIEFAFVKATEGVSHVDQTFAQNWVNTKRVGIIRGAYHYLRGAMDPYEQADLYLKTVKLEKGDFPPVLDVENFFNEGVKNDVMVKTAQTWLARVEQVTGIRPIVYSGPYFLQDRMRTALGAPSWAINYQVWMAQYPDNYHEGFQVMRVKGWQDWKFWQYTDRGRVPGINSYVDLDWFRGTIDELYAYVGTTRPEPAMHKVQEKDTVQSIAAQYGVPILDLLDANPQLIQPGMTLTIPPAVVDAAVTDVPVDDSASNPTPSTFVTYTVKPGDSLSGIAVKFNTTVEKIAAENGIANPNMITVGQVLKIPTSMN
jgi:GH25 family lysozyme M1 (1,4-beta-N-acetylmuramidase)